MKIDVSDLLKTLGAVLNIEISEKLSFKKEDGLALASPVKVKLKLVNTGDSVLVSGNIRADVKLSCCRCLKEFIWPANISIEEEYSKKEQEVQVDEEDEEVELKEKDFVFEISDDNIIDLDEAIRQNIIVSLPIKPLCHEQCKVMEMAGLTMKKTVDPRLAKLKTLKISGGK